MNENLISTLPANDNVSCGTQGHTPSPINSTIRACHLARLRCFSGSQQVASRFRCNRSSSPRQGSSFSSSQSAKTRPAYFFLGLRHYPGRSKPSRRYSFLQPPEQVVFHRLVTPEVSSLDSPISEPDCTHCCLKTFVASLGSSSVERLLQCVARQHAKNHRNAAIHRGVHKSR